MHPVEVRRTTFKICIDHSDRKGGRCRSRYSRTICTGASDSLWAGVDVVGLVVTTGRSSRILFRVHSANIT